MCVCMFVCVFVCLPFRSTEEVIALFISTAFVVDAVKGTVKSEMYICYNIFEATNCVCVFVVVVCTLLISP